MVRFVFAFVVISSLLIGCGEKTLWFAEWRYKGADEWHESGVFNTEDECYAGAYVPDMEAYLNGRIEVQCYEDGP